PRPLRTDAQLLAQIEDDLAGEGLESVVDRYRATYGMTPPIRRAGDGYEARTADDPAFRPVENPRHVGVGDMRLFEEIRLCTTAPDLLECAWAALGCERVDLNADGVVDGADAARFEDAFARYADLPENACLPRNDWCEGADLDRTGEADAVDRAFLEAAQGCVYEG
ncbi:MAG: hypothetical protein K8I02_04930, partial [Candidatus Methylomirabilis sp.]|nr:hypothetical protein [Deltaproteobacteria bacterium]